MCVCVCACVCVRVCVSVCVRVCVSGSQLGMASTSAPCTLNAMAVEGYVCV